MAGQLGQITVNIADNVMVGRLGATSLAALSFALAVFVVFFITSLGLGTAMQPLVSEADGGQRPFAVSVHFRHGLIINIVAAVVSIGLIELLLPHLDRFGQTEEVARLAAPYLRLNGWSLLPFMLFYSLRGLSEGLSRTTLPMIGMLLGNVLNIVLNYAFIYGNWGAPALGVEGAALGTLIARVFMGIILLLLLWQSKWVSTSGQRIRDYLRVAIREVDVKRSRFRDYLRMGLPNALQMLFEIGAFAGAAILMGMIGEKEQAAHQITINLISATFMVCMGFSVASTIRVGNGLGRRDRAAMRSAGLSSILQVILFMIACGVLLLIFRHQLPLLYMDDPEVRQIAAGLFLIAALFQISDGVQVTAIGALRGMQDVVYPTVVTFVAYLCIGLPVSYYSAFVLDFGPMGVWTGLLIGLTISALVNTQRFYRRSAMDLPEVGE